MPTNHSAALTDWPPNGCMDEGVQISQKLYRSHKKGAFRGTRAQPETTMSYKINTKTVRTAVTHCAHTPLKKGFSMLILASLVRHAWGALYHFVKSNSAGCDVYICMRIYVTGLMRAINFGGGERRCKAIRVL